MELKDCPFCKSYNISYGYDSGSETYVYCMNPPCQAIVRFPSLICCLDKERLTTLWNTRAYEAELTQLRADKAELVGAMAFYADPKNYQRLKGLLYPRCERSWSSSLMHKDGGKKARALITKHEGK